LWQAVCTVVRNIAKLSEADNLSDWRQYRYNLRQFKAQYRYVQTIKHSTSKDESKKQARADYLIEVHQDYNKIAKTLLQKAQQTLALDTIKTISTRPDQIKRVLKIKEFITHIERQMDQIERRVVKGETIPHKEKVFSLYQPHTEWVSKGKAGKPFELGLRVCILEDQHGFILHHKVMQKETDDKVAVEMVADAKKRFPTLSTCSFDQGFHSKQNQLDLKDYLEFVILPKKGKCNKLETAHENSEEFIAKKRQHSAVESGINALEQHGLDVCPDHGIDGFERYVALSVLARNVQNLGAKLRKQETKKEKKQTARKKRKFDKLKQAA
jgi:IS5 family transposase